MDGKPLNIREIAAAESAAACALMAVLREHLGEDEIAAMIRRLAGDGYVLFGAFFGPELAGLIGLRADEMLARGTFLYIDDLVVAEDKRGQGIGAALLAHAEAHARAQGVDALYLNARPGTPPFYEANGFTPTPAISMRKLL